MAPKVETGATDTVQAAPARALRDLAHEGDQVKPPMGRRVACRRVPSQVASRTTRV
jgi:hypothetical protein